MESILPPSCLPLLHLLQEVWKLSFVTQPTRILKGTAEESVIWLSWVYNFSFLLQGMSQSITWASKVFEDRLFYDYLFLAGTFCTICPKSTCTFSGTCKLCFFFLQDVSDLKVQMHCALMHYSKCSYWSSLHSKRRKLRLSYSSVWLK